MVAFSWTPISLSPCSKAKRTWSAELQKTESVFVPAIVLGELYFGARKSLRVQENLDRVEEFAAGTSILDCDKRTAHEYGRIKHLLRQRGRPLPDNDIWIAAMAFRFGLIVATRDAHFQQIDELETVGW